MRTLTRTTVLRLAALAGLVVLCQPAVSVAGITISDEETDPDALVRTLDPSDLPAGWELPAHTGHVVDYQVSEWNQYLIKGESDRAADYGITFTVADAGLDPAASITAIDELIDEDIEVLNFTAVDPDDAAVRVREVAGDGIPVICATSAVDGCATVVSAEDYDAAHSVGVWAGHYVKDHLGGNAIVLDVGNASLPSTVDRSRGFLDGITSILGAGQVSTISVDGNGLGEMAVTVATEALTEHPDVNVIFGINDDSAIGALQAYEAAGLNLESLIVVGFGCEGNACKDLLLDNGPFMVSAATFPEYQGRLLIDAGVAAFNGVTLPAKLVAPSVPMTALNVEQYYVIDDDGDYLPKFDAISSLPLTSEAGPQAQGAGLTNMAFVGFAEFSGSSRTRKSSPKTLMV